MLQITTIATCKDGIVEIVEVHNSLINIIYDSPNDPRFLITGNPLNMRAGNGKCGIVRFFAGFLIVWGSGELTNLMSHSNALLMSQSKAFIMSQS
jgi:hypothetical protein